MISFFRLLTPALIAFPLCLAACVASPKKSDAVYPEHWWAPVPSEGAPDWEILPQAANKKNGEVILSKRNELGLLSNFAATPFVYHGKTYASVEGFWQSLLYPETENDPRMKNKTVKWKFTRAEVEQMTAFDAKRAGGLAKANMKTMGIDWVTFEGQRMIYWTKEAGDHYHVIREVMREKARQNPEVMKVLLETGNLKLLPDHHTEPDAAPAWKYNEIWMALRSEFRQHTISQ